MACGYDGAFFIFFATIYRQQEEIETVGYREEDGHDGREVYIVHAWLHLKAAGVPNSCKEKKKWISHQRMDQTVLHLHHNVQLSITFFVLQNCYISIFFSFSLFVYSREGLGEYIIPPLKCPSSL
jgi:hypothetical protein